MEHLNDLLVSILLAITPIIVAILANHLRLYLARLEADVAAEVGAKNWVLLKDVAVHAIQAAEQLAGLDSNEEKKLFVRRAVEEAIEAMGMQADRLLIESLIEGVFKGLKDSGAIRSG